MSRGDFKLVTHPEHQPAVDFLTRSGEGPFVDTGLDVFVRTMPGTAPVKERVYLSVPTINQLARLVGVVQTPAEAALHEKKLIAQGKVESLKEGTRERLVSLASDLHRLLDDAGVRADAVAGN